MRRASSAPSARRARAAPTAVLALAAAAISLIVVAPAPSYDPWAWLLWGREVAGLELSTAEGPAFKPLPVAVATSLSLLGDEIAPVAWVLLARTGALLALWAAYRLGAGLADNRAAGLLAALGVATTGAFLAQAASGLSEPTLVALALTGAASARARRPRTALVCAAGCGLIRVETWPFLLLAGVIAGRRHPRLRPALTLLAALVPLAWFVPELLGSGDLLRSGSRARIPNPGQPALAPVPALASLAGAVALVAWPLWIGVAALLPAAARRTPARRRRREALVPAILGGAWLALVAAMAQAGFSGEPRYALPGATLISITGAVGIVELLRDLAPRLPSLLAAMAAAAPVAADRGADVASIPAAQAHHWRLSTSLRGAIQAAGGTRAVLACGTPHVGRYRGTLAAYQLGVPKHLVEADRPPRRPAVVFQSRLRNRSPAVPRPAGGSVALGRHGAWRIFASCRRDLTN